ncbi:MAG: hypothetical protein A2744_03370 [Candidatus Buchananbacteria bacterium RIFCSPHIGHO2_01_FULL_44_11]|uniref:Uncharacterized protein n=1 Tax=Candidatus Buchananbacteria bacterium RIFCSPHIGHO2_01_FULL_44_11 TaxID=1797535 RepID=A0A1G1Y293_9BACT|nr:MAG: hypothetical protein A2744_03370 [Candidatus Buchananbacteria bacterium RIFCSPHIGHO2_01_FULL_44_11]
MSVELILKGESNMSTNDARLPGDPGQRLNERQTIHLVTALPWGSGGREAWIKAHPDKPVPNTVGEKST